jgi:hypothetical protein
MRPPTSEKLVMSQNLKLLAENLKSSAGRLESSQRAIHSAFSPMRHHCVSEPSSYIGYLRTWLALAHDQRSDSECEPEGRALRQVMPHFGPDGSGMTVRGHRGRDAPATLFGRPRYDPLRGTSGVSRAICGPDIPKSPESS